MVVQYTPKDAKNKPSSSNPKNATPSSKANGQTPGPSGQTRSNKNKNKKGKKTGEANAEIQSPEATTTGNKVQDSTATEIDQKVEVIDEHLNANATNTEMKVKTDGTPPSKNEDFKLNSLPRSSKLSSKAESLQTQSSSSSSIRKKFELEIQLLKRQHELDLKKKELEMEEMCLQHERQMIANQNDSDGDDCSTAMSSVATQQSQYSKYNSVRSWLDRQLDSVSCKRSFISRPFDIPNETKITIQKKEDKTPISGNGDIGIGNAIPNNKVGENSHFVLPSSCDETTNNLSLEHFLARQSLSSKLPTFDGNPLEWNIFYSEYLNVSKICKYSPTENLKRLRESLTGKARESVQSMLSLPKNVDRVIGTLKERFGNPDIIVKHSMNKIRNFPSVREEKPELFVKFYDTLTGLIDTLESLDDQVHFHNSILFEEILTKIPYTQRVNFMQYHKNLQTNTPRIISFHSWLSRKISALNELSNITGEDDRHKFTPNSTSYDKSKGARPKESTFTVTEKSNKKDTFKMFCIYCNANTHVITDCTKFKSIDVNKRWEFTTKNALCISCFSKTHILRRCTNVKKCNVDGCKRNHNHLLHSTQAMTSTTQQAVTPPAQQAMTSTTQHVPTPSIQQAVTSSQSTNSLDLGNNSDKNYNINSNFPNKVLLKILPVRLENFDKVIHTFALLDDASTVTLIDQDLADDLQLDGPKKPLKIQWTNNQTKEQDDSRVVSVNIKGDFDKAKPFLLRRVKTISGLALPIQTVDAKLISDEFEFLKNFSNVSFENAQPRILIGQDNWPVVVSRKLLYGRWNGPVISKTLLGWVVHGNDNSMVDDNNDLVCHVYDTSTNFENKDDLDVLQDLIKSQWKLENDNTTVNDIQLSKDDKRCIKIMDDTIKRVDDRFECGLFWKTNNLTLPDSRPNAFTRLLHLERKMDKDEKYAEKYRQKFHDYVNRKLSRDEAAIHTPLTFYLPHFGVVNPNKPDKLRIVFDAAAKTKENLCLNDFLLTGPDLYNSLPNILMNFRINHIAFAGDIREMFLQIKVRETDRHAQRILFRDMDRDRHPDIYEIQVVFFGAKCSPCIAQEIKNRNALDFKEKYPLACEEILSKHYMDDYLGGADTVDNAVRLINEVKVIHEAAGFQMCNWVCNSKDVLQQIGELKEIDSKEVCDELKEERILGLWWNYDTDTFSYHVNLHKVNPDVLNLSKIPTKRDLLKVVMSIFDPLGFLANFLITGKILLQNVWDSGIAWDDVLKEEQLCIWKEWISKLNQITNLSIPRQYTSISITDCNIQLHIFCDASKHAYASCAYLRFEKNDKVECILVTAKSRVAPLKPTSIPRLELQAALLGARLYKHLKQTLNFRINKSFLWSDSQVVLSWIRTSSRRFKVFVAQRLGEIQELTDTSDWRYVKSSQNISDDATKIKNVDLSPDSQWIKGPTFLYQNMSQWPNDSHSLSQDLNTDEEYLIEFVNVVNDNENQINIPDVTQFNNWYEFLQATARLSKVDGELYPSDLSEAEVLIYKKIQLDSYPDEINCIRKNKSLPKKSNIKTLPVTISEDGLIRLHGRLNNVADDELTYNSKNLILLDHRHAITQLIISYYHEQNNHIGTETIMSNLRKVYWITSCRLAVKKSAINCQYCREMKAKPAIPIMGQLPECRVNVTSRPFIKTGVDYFGPIEITVNRSHVKRYGVIFTCMVTRAIDLQIAEDLSCDSFMHVFRQFGCKRGFPEQMFSDNGTNFRKAEKEIRAAIDSWEHKKISNYATMKNCKWVFNPPSAPHMGGAWERLIRSVKEHIKYLLKDKYPKEYVLRTVFSEVENMVNSRPLTHVPLDSNDIEPLTPNDLLIGPAHRSLQFAETKESDETFLNMWRASQRLADKFWYKWKNIYRQHLMCNRKWTKDCQSLQENDSVLIMDSDSPRNNWPKGVIIKTYPAKDGRVRIVDVKVGTVVYRRPVTKLVKINVS